MKIISIKFYQLDSDVSFSTNYINYINDKKNRLLDLINIQDKYKTIYILHIDIQNCSKNMINFFKMENISYFSLKFDKY